MNEKEYDFPEDFLFGTATSAYQIEGHNFNNDWYEFEQNPQNTRYGEKCGIAADHWNRYKEDFDFLDQLNVKSYRMSLEWSRIFPQEGEIDQNALDHYQKMIKDLKKRNIKVMVNLHHFCFPLWFVRKGGIKFQENIRYFEEYTDLVAKEFGEEVDIWCTMNEPMVVVVNGFYFGTFPPRERRFRTALKVFRNFIRMHASAYNILKERNPNSPVGLVKATTLFETLTKSVRESLKAKYTDYIYNLAAFKSIKSGKLPFSLVFKQKHLKNSSDYIGINYYSRIFVSKKHFPETGYHGAQPQTEPEYLCAGLNWQPYPRGIYEQLKRFSKLFPNKPLFITENGIGTDNDTWRQYYLLAHLIEIKRALDEGIDVMGYHYWSLIDNFEWTHGFGPRFGLVHINYETLERTMKESGHLYSRICKNKAISQSDVDKALAQYPNIDDSLKLSPHL